MDELFEASFSSVADAGRPISRYRRRTLSCMYSKANEGLGTVLVQCAFPPNFSATVVSLAPRLSPPHKNRKMGRFFLSKVDFKDRYVVEMTYFAWASIVVGIASLHFCRSMFVCLQ